jgi:hypothetical protein
MIFERVGAHAHRSTRPSRRLAKSTDLTFAHSVNRSPGRKNWPMVRQQGQCRGTPRVISARGHFTLFAWCRRSLLVVGCLDVFVV